MEQQSKEVVLTYETLYELSRKEKSKEELQKIDSKFFLDALAYFKNKHQAYDETLTKNDIFSQSERDKLHIQIANIKKILRDLYDIRERKIINMSINVSRTKAQIFDVAHLLPQEKSLFESLNAILNQHRTGIIHRVLELREPELLPIMLPMPTMTTEEQKAETFEEPNIPDRKHVKFLDQIESFVGEELETYGPYATNDEAELPRELADILISQGKAVEL